MIDVVYREEFPIPRQAERVDDDVDEAKTERDYERLCGRIPRGCGWRRR